jgi:hypothetical protein
VNSGLLRGRRRRIVRRQYLDSPELDRMAVRLDGYVAGRQYLLRSGSHEATSVSVAVIEGEVGVFDYQRAVDDLPDALTSIDFRQYRSPFIAANGHVTDF